MNTTAGIAAEPLQRRIRWGAVSWIGILLAIGVVQLVRAQWFDAAVFLVVSLVLAVDAGRASWRGGAQSGLQSGRRGGSEDDSRGASQMSWTWLAAVAAVVGVTACIVPRYSLVMQVLVCATGAAVILFVWLRGSDPQSLDPQSAAWRGSRVAGPWPPGLRRLTRVWAVILIAGCLWELAQFILGLIAPLQPAFALSNLLDPLVSTWPGKAVFVALWVVTGFFLVRRGRG